MSEDYQHSSNCIAEIWLQIAKSWKHDFPLFLHRKKKRGKKSIYVPIGFMHIEHKTSEKKCRSIANACCHYIIAPTLCDCSHHHNQEI